MCMVGSISLMPRDNYQDTGLRDLGHMLLSELGGLLACSTAKPQPWCAGGSHSNHSESWQQGRGCGGTHHTDTMAGKARDAAPHSIDMENCE